MSQARKFSNMEAELSNFKDFGTNEPDIPATHREDLRI